MWSLAFAKYWSPRIVLASNIDECCKNMLPLWLHWFETSTMAVLFLCSAIAVKAPMGVWRQNNGEWWIIPGHDHAISSHWFAPLIFSAATVPTPSPSCSRAAPFSTRPSHRERFTLSSQPCSFFLHSPLSHSHRVCAALPPPPLHPIPSAPPSSSPLPSPASVLRRVFFHINFARLHSRAAQGAINWHCHHGKVVGHTTRHSVYYYDARCLRVWNHHSWLFYECYSRGKPRERTNCAFCDGEVSSHRPDYMLSTVMLVVGRDHFGSISVAVVFCHFDVAAGSNTDIDQWLGSRNLHISLPSNFNRPIWA